MSKKNCSLPHAKFDLSTKDTFLHVTGKEQKGNHTQAINKTVKNHSAVHLHLGHWLMPPAVNCSDAVSFSHPVHCNERRSFGMGDQKKKAQRGASEVSMPREFVHLYSLSITLRTASGTIHHV